VSFVVDAISITLGTGNIPFACCNTATASRSREAFNEGDDFMAVTILISLCISCQMKCFDAFEMPPTDSCSEFLKIFI
jgi:hypothetical protein